MRISILAFFPCVLAIALISGCSSSVRQDDASVFQTELDRARKLSNEGDHAGAALIYARLSKKNPAPWSDVFRLQAAESWFDAQEIEDARKWASRVKPANLSLLDRSRLHLLNARIFLAKNKPDQVLVELQSGPARNLGETLQFEHYQLRAKAYSMLGQHYDSAREYVLAEALLRDPNDVERIQRAIMDELASVSNAKLTQLEAKAPNRLKGWMQLTRLFKETRPGTPAFEQRVEAWKHEFPRHSANIAALIATVSLERDPFTMPEAIAVILPLSGPFAPSGEAVRQGILIARKYDGSNRIETRFYDSQSASIAKLYKRVIADGADIVIGPLEKPLLKTLASAATLSVPVLGLNQLPDLNVPNLYQFGLNPEDEVEQAANSAWFDGYHRALILAPGTSHGRRLAGDFSKKWQQLGGEVVRAESYNPKDMRFDPVIRRLLNTDRPASRTRIGSGNTSPAPPKDSDFVFLVAQPAQARLIKPLIDHYNQGQMAVYGTSQVYSGHESRDEDEDLNGLSFCDIPWLFHSTSQDAPTLEEIRANWPHPATDFVRMMALGIDAYHLLAELPALEADPTRSFAGLTGVLSLTGTRQVRRQLVCAQFQDGVPVQRSLSPLSRANFRQSNRIPSWSG